MHLISKSPYSLLLHKTGGFCFFSFLVTQVQNRNIITSDTYPFFFSKKISALNRSESERK